jgi:hypothetical protein
VAYDVLMNAYPRQLPARPTRRNLLVAGLALSVSGIARLARAQADGPVLTRAIPHSGEQLPVVGLGTAVSFPSADRTQREALKRVIEALIGGGAKLIDTASV